MIIRKNIREFLRGNQAHMTFNEGIQDFPESAMNIIFPNGTYSSWHLLEHIRRTQHDILDFMINPDYKELEWPKDYWPNVKETATPKKWKETLKKYYKDLEQLEKMVMNPKIDLTEKIPHGAGQTYIREFLLVIDHTSYHIGEFAIMRQTLNNWGK